MNLINLLNFLKQEKEKQFKIVKIMKLSAVFLLIATLQTMATGYTQNVPADQKGAVLQQISISGTVTENGEPLPGVTVMVKGTSIGTATDIDGRYKIIAPNAESVLQFSFVGYTTIEFLVGDRTVFDVEMREDTQALEEVVVIGYGVMKKSLVSGAISKVSSTDLEKMLPTRLEDVLNGKVSGMQIMQHSGQPNSGSDVYIRGIGTINSAGPLYVVDGMQIQGNISFLNPKDIESVEVLKDAASSAIYGTRGANGVIMITTKQGKSGKTMVNYDFSYGWQNTWKKRELLDAQEYMFIMNEMAINDNGVPPFTAEEIRNAKTTDWQDEVFNKNAPVINHNVSLTGGSENHAYAVSFGYFKQDGIIGGNYGKSNVERYNFRINANQVVYETKTRDFLNKLNVGVNFNYTRQESTSIDANSEWGSVLGSAIGLPPHLPVYAEDPDDVLSNYPYAIKDRDGRVFSLPPVGFQELGNPMAMLANDKQYSLNSEDVFVGGAWAELDIWKGIKFRSSYSVDMSFWGNNGYNMPYFIASQGKFIDDLEHSNIYGEKNRRYSWQVENYISWNERFAGKHDVMVMIGQSARKSIQSQIGGSRGIPTFDEHDLLLNMNSTADNKNYFNVYGYFSGGSVNFYALASYYGRINYSYDGRYILSASLRRDGSSNFGPDNKWGVFPAVSVAWNILNEPYISNKPAWMNAAKFRASWGRNGNDQIGALRYITTYSRGGSFDYYFGGGFDPRQNAWQGQLVSGVQPGALENRMLGWEESDQINIGFDVAMLRNSLNVSFDWFKKTTIGMLQEAFLPGSTGQSPPWGNVGDMSNKGIEINVGYKGRAGNFNYFVDANATYVKTILDKYASATGIQYNMESNGAGGVGEYMRGATGEVYPFFYGLKTDGLFQNLDDINNYTTVVSETVWDADLAQEVTKETLKVIQPTARPGDLRFIDQNGDGEITDADKVKIGKPMPDWIFGVTLGGSWKGFDFNLFFKSAVGFQIYDFSQRADITTNNRPAWILDRWHGEGTSNSVPRITATDPNGNIRSSDLYLKNGNYLRLKTAQLGYTLPRNLTDKIAIQKIRFYVAAYNLFTLTGYDGFEVELGARSIDRGIYPQARTVSVGVEVTF